MGFLVLRPAPEVYSRVTTGMPILNGSLFSEVRAPPNISAVSMSREHGLDGQGI